MVKLIDPDVPPEFEAAMKDIMTSLPSGPGDPVIARTRRKARLPLSKYTARRQLEAIRSACEILADRLDMPAGTDERRAFVYAQCRLILTGTFDPAYWTPQYRQSQVVISSTPTSADDPDPPPYSYRTIDNLPSRPTYAPGALDAGQPRYTGWTTGERFDDKLLAWQRAVYDLDNELNDRDSEPTFYKLAGLLQMDSDARGSRGMASIMAQREFAPPGSLPDFDSAVPLANALSFYWRYRPPKGVAPYYSFSLPRNIIARLYPSDAALAGAPLSDLAMSVWPRALMGREFNNNTLVTTSLSNTENVFQISEDIGAEQKPIIYTHADIPHAANIHTGAETAMAPVASYRPPQSSLSRVLLGEYIEDYRVRSTKGKNRGALQMPPPPENGWGHDLGAAPAACGFMRWFYHPPEPEKFWLLQFDRAGQCISVGDLAGMSWPWAVEPTLIGEVVEDRVVFNFRPYGIATFTRSGALIGAFPRSGFWSDYCLTRTGIWFMDSSARVWHTRYGSGDALMMRALPYAGAGIAQYQDGVYIAAGSSNTGIIHLDGSFEPTPVHSYTGLMNGWTLNWRPA